MFGSIGSVFEAAVAKVAEWRRREIARAELQSLDDRALADIGLTRGEIQLVIEGRYRPSIEPLVGSVPTGVAANSNAAAARRVA